MSCNFLEPACSQIRRGKIHHSRDGVKALDSKRMESICMSGVLYSIMHSVYNHCPLPKTVNVLANHTSLEENKMLSAGCRGGRRSIGEDEGCRRCAGPI